MNRYPLLYPDSITYIAAGRPVARALFLHQFSDYYGMRSLIYSLGILPFHWNVSPWPVVFFCGLLSAYLLWLVVRSVAPRLAVLHFFLVIAVLGLLTSLSWYVSLIMPDVLGPLLCLCAYLLVFARETLSRAERICVAGIAWWAAASHLTHLVLAAVLCVLLALLWLLRARPLRARGKGIGEFALIVAAAAASLLALNYYLFGAPSLNADSPPFLTARLIADGPGRWYLERNCPEVRLALCEFIDDLPDDSDEFLWNPHGIWPEAAGRGDDRIRREEMRFVLGTPRAYPRDELTIAAAHWWQQISAFGLWDLDRNNWVLEAFDSALPGEKWRYLNGSQANDDLPLDFFSATQYWAVAGSLAAILIFLPAVFRSDSALLVGLGAIILPALLANALLTGAFSNVEERYQSRAIWLLPLLALMLFLHWREARRVAHQRLGSATWRGQN